MKFTADNITIIEDVLLNGRDHTLRSLVNDFAHNDVQERQIDKIIQRLRKRGRITMRREGRNIIWTATPSKAARAA